MKIEIVYNNRFVYATKYALYWNSSRGVWGYDCADEALRTQFERLILEARLRGEL